MTPGEIYWPEKEANPCYYKNGVTSVTKQIWDLSWIEPSFHAT
jgi:hypothetical protein